MQHYHSHLYKEYVLADLSRVKSGKDGHGGPVGLRWRTEREVKEGRGFTSCGNLACCHPKADEEYTRRVRTALGVGVAESGGSIPTGVVLPSEKSEMIERYLKSCEREERKKMRREHKRTRREISRTHDTEYISNKLETKELKRLSRVPHGVGLHDYEVDFAYNEQNQQKRELVKVRLCLRCAPLVFEGWGLKARYAREKAAKVSIEDATNDVNKRYDDNSKFKNEQTGTKSSNASNHEKDTSS